MAGARRSCLPLQCAFLHAALSCTACVWLVPGRAAAAIRPPSPAPRIAVLQATPWRCHSGTRRTCSAAAAARPACQPRRARGGSARHTRSTSRWAGRCGSCPGHWACGCGLGSPDSADGWVWAARLLAEGSPPVLPVPAVPQHGPRRHHAGGKPGRRVCAAGAQQEDAGGHADVLVGVCGPGGWWEEPCGPPGRTRWVGGLGGWAGVAAARSRPCAPTRGALGCGAPPAAPALPRTQGESVEEAVRRETREEAGVELAAVDIVGSQPWPVGARQGWRAGVAPRGRPRACAAPRLRLRLWPQVATRRVGPVPTCVCPAPSCLPGRPRRFVRADDWVHRAGGGQCTGGGYRRDGGGAVGLTRR